jgi:D-arabinose 1-dehydrogenase-like Zn-dependent alcohol dehydrogenase
MEECLLTNFRNRFRTALNSNPLPATGDLAAVQGIGGLGHLGVQFARQMGFRTVAIARGCELAADACMMQGKARFRMVLVTKHAMAQTA